jgi:hypothetical protein
MELIGPIGLVPRFCLEHENDLGIANPDAGIDQCKSAALQRACAQSCAATKELVTCARMPAANQGSMTNDDSFLASFVASAMGLQAN